MIDSTNSNIEYLKEYLHCLEMSKTEIDWILSNYSPKELFILGSFSELILNEKDIHSFNYWADNWENTGMTNNKAKKFLLTMFVNYFKNNIFRKIVDFGGDKDSYQKLRNNMRLFFKSLRDKNVFTAFLKQFAYINAMTICHNSKSILKNVQVSFVAFSVILFYSIRYFVIDNNVLLILNTLVFLSLVYRSKRFSFILLVVFEFIKLTYTLVRFNTKENSFG